MVRAVPSHDDAPPAPLPPSDRPKRGPIGALLQAGFRVAARVGDARAFHPKGTTWEGEFHVTHPLGGADHAFATPGAFRAHARFSIGAGLPAPLPDVQGVAIRLVDAYGEGAHQDLLMASSLSPPLLRHTILPLPRGRHTTFSTVLPYAVEGRGLLLFGAALHPARAWDDPYDAGDVDLVVASLTGPWQPLGRFRLGGPLDEATAARLHFDPWNAGNGLRPVGRLNDWRLPAYEGSRTGRNAVGEPAQNGANRQQV